MTRQYEYVSVFASDIVDYLQFKAGFGIACTSRNWHLGKFDQYCATNNLTVFDKTTIEAWVKDMLTHSGVSRSWMSYIRDMGRWMALYRDPNAYVLDPSWVAGVIDPHPYLFTQQQLEHFFTAAASFRPRSTWRWQAVGFFGLMCSMGLRTCEVLRLDRSDVDLDHLRLTIKVSKAHKGRTLPLSQDVADVLRHCDNTMGNLFPAREPFFVSSTGHRLSPSGVGVAFKRIWCQAGLTWPADATPPRPYDLRHHFAYANLERWARDGGDVNTMLPYLSAFMGHASFASTFYYVHVSPDFMDTYADVTQAIDDTVMPQVGFE